MLAIHIASGVVEVRDAPLPDRPPGFALIRLICGGICNTDLELQRGYYGFSGTPGHEFVGEVIDADNASLLGRRVVGEINLDFSEFFTLPERNLHALPEQIATEDAVFTEPLAAACEILDQVAIPRGGDVAVLGDGKLGLLVALALAAHGAAVRLFGRHPEKLRIAASAGVAVEVASELPRATYDWVVEATGAAEGLRQAIAMARPRGTVIMKSTVHGEVAFDAAVVVVNEITLIGSRCGRFEPALELLRDGALPLREMISDRFPLAEAPRAFARAAERGALKVLLD